MSTKRVKNSDGTEVLAGGKDTNPKDLVGVRKWRQYCAVPFTVVWELGVAMLEGALKYGRHNYRVSGVRASVYVEATKGHVDCFWEGQDIDPDSKLHHLTKAMASLAVLRDAMIQGKWIDDRPPKTDIEAFSDEMQVRVEELLNKYPEPIPPYLEGDQHLAPAELAKKRAPKTKKTTTRKAKKNDKEWVEHLRMLRRGIKKVEARHMYTPIKPIKRKKGQGSVERKRTRAERVK